MSINVHLELRNKSCYAEGIYSETEFVVKKGGKIRREFAQHIVGGSVAKKYRDNPEYVDDNGNILKDCLFTSPSTAAQFVTGRSTNGYIAWKVEKKKNLKEYLREQGMR